MKEAGKRSCEKQAVITGGNPDKQDKNNGDEEVRAEKVKERLTRFAQNAANKGGNALSCAVLDFRAVKSYIWHTQPTDIFISAATMMLAIIIMFVSNMFFGFLLMLFSAWPYLYCSFVVREKFETDILYKSLELSPRSIVAGRYLFFTSLNTLVALGAALIVYARAHLLWRTDYVFMLEIGIADIVRILLVLTVLALAVVMVGLPLYFRLGLKMRYLETVLILALIGVQLIGPEQESAFGSYSELAVTTNNLWLIAVSVGVLIVAGIVSYRISLSIYEKQLASS